MKDEEEDLDEEEEDEEVIEDEEEVDDDDNKEKPSGRIKIPWPAPTDNPISPVVSSTGRRRRRGRRTQGREVLTR